MPNYELLTLPVRVLSNHTCILIANFDVLTLGSQSQVVRPSGAETCGFVLRVSYSAEVPPQICSPGGEQQNRTSSQSAVWKPEVGARQGGLVPTPR